MLNSLPHYQVTIGGIRLHFIHVPGRGRARCRCY
jgi:hypothetical protein